MTRSRITHRARPSFNSILIANSTDDAPRSGNNYPDTRRFVAAEFFGRSSQRTINQVVIHITSGNQLSSTFWWFRHPRRPIRKVFRRGTQDQVGTISSHVFLQRADTVAGGGEAIGPILFAPPHSRRHTALFDRHMHELSPLEQQEVPVSAHYVVDRDGEVYQFVEEQNIAYHAGRANAHSIGIEHVCSASAHPTEVQYQRSARLVKYLCEKYNIPKIHAHSGQAGVLGHQEADPGTDHHCPGRSWNWESYLAMVNSILIA